MPLARILAAGLHIAFPGLQQTVVVAVQIGGVQELGHLFQLVDRRLLQIVFQPAFPAREHPIRKRQAASILMRAGVVWVREALNGIAHVGGQFVLQIDQAQFVLGVGILAVERQDLVAAHGGFVPVMVINIMLGLFDQLGDGPSVSFHGVGVAIVTWAALYQMRSALAACPAYCRAITAFFECWAFFRRARALSPTPLWPPPS